MTRALKIDGGPAIKATRRNPPGESGQHTFTLASAKKWRIHTLPDTLKLGDVLMGHERPFMITTLTRAGGNMMAGFTGKWGATRSAHTITENEMYENWVPASNLIGQGFRSLFDDEVIDTHWYGEIADFVSKHCSFTITFVDGKAEVKLAAKPTGRRYASDNVKALTERITELESERDELEANPDNERLCVRAYESVLRVLHPHVQTRDERQRRMAEWVRTRFGADHQTDKQERLSRLVEEALELAQSEGMPIERIRALISHVWKRPVGEPKQEAGGLGVTLLAYAEAAGFSADDAEMTELARIESKPIEHFQERQQTKHAAGIGTSCKPKTCKRCTYRGSGSRCIRCDQLK